MAPDLVQHYHIYHRYQSFVNTDPQKRCYNGCHFSGEWQWSDWERVEYGVPSNKIDDRLKFWKELNDYAVSERGPSARKEFKKVAPNETP